MGLAETAFRLSIKGHVLAYRATGGRFVGKRLLLLTTTGRKSGKRRVVPLMRIEDGDDFVVAGSMGGAPSHPGWYYNLVDNPQVTIQVGRTVEDRIARVAEGSDRERLWSKIISAEQRFADYESKTDRVIPVVMLQPIEPADDPVAKGSDANMMIEPMEQQPTTRVEKPWGWELWWTVTDRYVGKVIFINAGQRLSLQYHNEKDESVFVIDGEMILHLENAVGELEPITLGPGQFRRVEVGKRHRFEAITDTRIIEVSTPELDDVVRLEDDFGREGTSQP